MAESDVSITEGSGLDLHSWTRTISAGTKHEQVIARAEGFLPTWTAIAVAVSAATSADHLLFIQADGTNYSRVRRITVRQVALASSASTVDLRVLRTSTAGTGGSTVNARPFDAADTDPYAGTCMTLPTAKGTEGNQLLQMRMAAWAAQPVSNTAFVEWRESAGSKPIIIGTATTSGLVCKVQTGIASLTVDVEIEFVVSAYL